MSLENLLKIGQLKLHPANAEEIDRLLTSAQRNVADYTGDDIDESTAEYCITEARRLIDEVLAWRKEHRPALIVEP